MKEPEQLEFFDPGPRKRRGDGPDDGLPRWVVVLAWLFCLSVGAVLLSALLHACGLEVLP